MRVEPYDRQERVAVSPSVRQLLLYFAAGDESRDIPRVDADWAALLEAVSSHGLIAMTARLLKGKAGYPPPEFCAEVWRRYEITTVRTMLLYRRVTAVLRGLVNSGLDFVVLKGPALGATVYPDSSLRVFNDLDIMVRSRDWAAADKTLRGLGFTPEQDLPVAPPKLVPQDMRYEMLYHGERDGFLVEVHYDDVLQAGLAARDVEGFWYRATTVVVEGVSVKVLSLEDQIVHLCAHMHCHRYGRLNWLSDLAFLMRRYSESIDWSQVMAVTVAEDAAVPVYYGLYFLQRLLGTSVPHEVLRTLEPDRFRRWVHNLLLPGAKVVSLEPLPQPIFSFYFHPVLQRLLPDLLVMGRRQDKLHYLFRLVTPPREWLTHYYGLSPSRGVGIHYLLHPMKLVYHFLDECLSVARSVAVGS